MNTSTGHQPVEGMTGWYKSSYSAANGDCVEMTDHSHMVFMRDSKLGDGSPVLGFTPGEWAAFIASVKAGDLE